LTIFLGEESATRRSPATFGSQSAPASLAATLAVAGVTAPFPVQKAYLHRAGRTVHAGAAGVVTVRWLPEPAEPLTLPVVSPASKDFDPHGSRADLSDRYVKGEKHGPRDREMVQLG
jgi:hypothetical protein